MRVIIGCILGLFVGLLLKVISPAVINEVKIFQRGEGKPAVMRVYKDGVDNLLVEKDGKYIPLIEYLDTIKDKYDRKIEEVTIKKVVDEGPK